MDYMANFSDLKHNLYYSIGQHQERYWLDLNSIPFVKVVSVHSSENRKQCVN